THSAAPRGMGVPPMYRGTPRCSTGNPVESVKAERPSDAREKKNAMLPLDWPEYRPELRSTAAHGRDAHATGAARANAGGVSHVPVAPAPAYEGGHGRGHRPRVRVFAGESARRQAAPAGDHRDPRAVLHADGHALPGRRAGDDGRIRGRTEVRRRVVR